MFDNKFTDEAFDELVQLIHTEPYVMSVRSYSGRGMMGKDCVGIVVDDLHDGLWHIGGIMRDHNLPAPIVDNMGLDYILYWPKWEWKPKYNKERYR